MFFLWSHFCSQNRRFQFSRWESVREDSDTSVPTSLLGFPKGGEEANVTSWSVYWEMFNTGQTYKAPNRVIICTHPFSLPVSKSIKSQTDAFHRISSFAKACFASLCLPLSSLYSCQPPDFLSSCLWLGGWNRSFILPLVGKTTLWPAWQFILSLAFPFTLCLHAMPEFKF